MRAGSIVMLGDNLGEKFIVVHIAFSKAWIRPVKQVSPSEHELVPLSRLREVGSVYPSFPLRRSGAEL